MLILIYFIVTLIFIYINAMGCYIRAIIASESRP